jgi:DNA-binding NarL/FixJ family response regulator
MPITILIVDDHPIFRKGLIDILQIAMQNCILEEASNGEQAIQLLQKNTYQIALLDVDMPQIDGFGVCREIKANYTHTKVVFLTMYKDITVFHTAMELGADGFLLKDNTAEEIIECLEKVGRNQKYVSQQLGEYQNQYQEYSKKKRKLKSLIDELTQTERRTLKLVSENYSSKEIADILFVTAKSVENYRSRICKKLGLETGNNALVKWTLDNKEFLKQIEW